MVENSGLTRCFVAIELPREVINYIREIQALLKKKNLFYGKFTEPENLHLTLKFIGEIDEGMVEDVRARLKKIDFSDFESSLGDVGVFSRKFLKMIWIKLDGRGIFNLQKKVDEVLDGLFEPEQRFMSHITIARLKGVPNEKEFLEYIKKVKIKKIGFKVDRFFLKKSELKPEGPVYFDIEKYNLES
jgi:2'-5' RNA ligase